MIGKLKKFGRSLTRDHLPLVDKYPILGGLAGGLGSAIVRGALGAGSFIGVGATLAIIAGVSWGFKYRRIRKMTGSKFDLHFDMNTGSFVTRRLEGPGEKIHTILRTRALIEKLSEGREYDTQLPAKLQRRIDAHVADAQEAARHVRLLHDDTEQREFPLLRPVFNSAAGGYTKAPVATLSMKHTPTPAEITAAQAAAEKAKIAQGQAAADGIHAGSAETLTVRPIKLKQNKKH